MYQKKDKHMLQKISPHLSQLNVAISHMNYFRRNNLNPQIGNIYGTVHGIGTKKYSDCPCNVHVGMSFSITH